METVSPIDMALSCAERSAKDLHAWVTNAGSPDSQPKAFGLSALAQVLESCWKARNKTIPSMASFAECAEHMGFAWSKKTARGRWYNWNDSLVEKLWLTRNDIVHLNPYVDRFSDEEVWQAFGLMFLECTIALGKRLELKLERSLWLDLTGRQTIAAEVDTVFRSRAAEIASSYLRCPHCGRQMFDAGHGSCRFCLSRVETTTCSHDRRVLFASQTKRFVREIQRTATVDLCAPCFEVAARARVNELAAPQLARFPKTTSRQPNRVIPVGGCPTCAYRAFDLEKARCLVCGFERPGMRRCRGCGRMFAKANIKDRCCEDCRRIRSECIVCSERFSIEYIVEVGGETFCRRCAKLSARCAVCLAYAPELVRGSLRDARRTRTQRRQKATGLRRNLILKPSLEQIYSMLDKASPESRSLVSRPRYCPRCEALLAEAREIVHNVRQTIRQNYSTNVSRRQMSYLLAKAVRTVGPELPWRRIPGQLVGMPT